MGEATLTSVALPNGIDPQTGGARLSIFLSPRLTPDDGDQLGGFPDFLDWPLSLRPDEVRFVVTVDGQDEIEARVVSERPRSDLWTALFGSDVFVREPATEGMVERPFVGYPHRNVSEYLKARYQDMASAHPTGPPPGDMMAAQFGELMPMALRMVATRAETDRHVEGILLEARARARVQRDQANGRFDPALPAVMAGDDMPEGPLRDFTQFELFHHRPERVGVVALAKEVVDRRRLVEFHAALSALGDHPALLRQLGLVVDVELDAGSLPAATAAEPRSLSARPVWPGSAPAVTVGAPLLAFVNSDRLFRAAGRPPEDGGSGNEVVGGLVALGNGSWDLVGLDVDGAAFKALGALASVAGAEGGGSAGDGHETLAALRTAGLALARSGTVGHLRRAVVTQHRAAADEMDAPLFAEDVTRGYRLDVLESRTGKWRSVHARRVSYTVLGGPPVAPVADEGFVRRGVTHPPVPPGEEPPDEAEIYAHDVLCGWQGWSLAAPRPGKAISIDPRAPRPGVPETQPQRVVNEPIPEGIPLQAGTAVEPGSLPRLRFGESYRVRLRTVDLAGNGPTLSEADALVADNPDLSLPKAPEPELYRRFEPVGSPELVARAEVREGESIARLVIRSDFDLSAPEWAAKHKGFLAACERHVVPPKVAELMAEQHGMFDAAIGTGKGVEAAYQAARKERGQLSDARVLLSDGSTVAQKVRVDDTPAGKYVINQEERLVVPYLPDPLASGVTLEGAPGVEPGTVLHALGGGGFGTDHTPPALDPAAQPDALVTVPFGGRERWPEVETFRLRLAGGSRPPEWDAAARVLVVRLPRAGRARMKLSCFPPGDRLDDFSLRQWVAERMDEDEASGRSSMHAKTAALGRTWAISPAREVELVHAVQRPLVAPVVRRLAASRLPATTFTYLDGAFRVDGASSDRLELLADWRDTVDRVEDGGGPREIQGAAHVLDVPIHLARDAVPGAADVQDPGVVPAGEYVEKRDVVRLTAPAPDDQSGREFLSRHEFGDTRHRRVGYRVLCTSRFRDYFPVKLAENPVNVSRESARVEVDVPSSARPAPPRVLYIVPMFEWQRAADAAHPNRHVSRRRGGGLRVYLDRPWFSSGVGEQLGVVLWPDPKTGPPEEVLGLVSRWGRDPIWSAPTKFRTPSPASFRLATGTPPQLLRLEERDVEVTVAGHDVAYDPARKLWFCDIEIDAGDSYTPFVRLALARWQPHSVTGVELSGVVLAEYAQLAPERAVTVVHDRADPTRVTVSVTGRTYRDVGAPVSLLPAGQLGSVVRVRVERRVPGTRGPVGWVDAMGDTGVKVDPDEFAFDEKLRWRGRLRIPADRDRGRYRVAVREHERFAADDGAGGFQEADRLVFAETVEL
jgi:hypothetical protein